MTPSARDHERVRELLGREPRGGYEIVVRDDVPPDSLVFLEREDDEPILWDGRRAEFTEAEQ